MAPVPKERIAAWKKEYGKVFEVRYRNQTFIIRPFSFGELDEIAAHTWSSAEAEDHLVQLCVLWPEEYDFERVPAGLVTTLADKIKDKSGQGDVVDLIELLNEARQRQGGLRGMMDAFILATMPAVHPDELDKMNIIKKAELVAKAEEIIYVQQNAQGLEVNERTRLHLQTPEEIEAEMQERIDEGTATKYDPIAQKLRQAAAQEGLL